MEKIDLHIQSIFDFIKRYEMFVNKVITKIIKPIFKLISLFKRTVFIYADLVSQFSRFARYTTYPVHWLLIFIDIRKMKPKTEDLPIFKVGAHYIYGKPGSGKSTMTYHAMMDYGYHTGKASLTTAQMEIPRTALNGSLYYLHQRFSPSDLFIDGKQEYSINSDRFNMIVYEEMLTQYNQRNNKESRYNDEVIPMIGALGTQRHQGIDLFYFISQLPKSDIQIMLMLSGYHIPKVKKGFDYKYWLETGKYRFTIKGWRIKSYEITPSGSMDYELTNKRTWFYPNILEEDMKYFNRLNMQKEFSSKPRLQLGAKE